jgi:predicted DNA-binding transcriptional regulator AlpA
MSATTPETVSSLLSEHEAAALLGVSRAYLYRLRTSMIPAYQNPPPAPRHLRIGKRIKYRPADIQAWIDGISDGSLRAVRRGRPTKAETARRLETQARAGNNLAA